MEVAGKERPKHTAKYLAWKAEREQFVKTEREKRKRASEAEVQTQAQSKRAKSAELEEKMAKARLDAVENVNEMLAEGTVEQYRRVWGEKWSEALELDLRALERGQDALRTLNGQQASKSKDDRRVEIQGLGGMLEFGVRS